MNLYFEYSRIKNSLTLDLVFCSLSTQCGIYGNLLSYVLFFQKFRESNVLTKEITKVNLTEETFGKHFCILGCFSMHGTKILSNQLFSNTVWKSKVKRDHAQKFSVKIHT